MKFICPATSDDADAINGLRVEEYGHASEFVVLNHAAICWNGEPNPSVVIAAWNSGHCMATMEGTIATNLKKAEKILECHLDLSDEHLPALVLTRAATSHAERRSGLNSALRYYFLLAARHGRSVIGTVNADARRTNLMAAIGYRFDPVLNCHIKTLRHTKEQLLATLPACRFETAIKALRDRIAETLDSYPWRGERLSLTIESSPTSASLTDGRVQD